ncbi:MAG: sigma-70 family RNA polymerase sigma factor [Clostridiales bacterium]|nr:sigma-70 family RNA polymerase sigma factor [Clostridiales bacterium]
MVMIYLSAIESPEEKVKFEALYDKYRGFMLKVASRVLRGDQDAEDAVHNAFMSLAKNMKLVPELDSLKLRGFLYIVTENKAIDILRERKRRELEAPLDEGQPLYAPVIDEEQDLAWCISRLPPRYQEVILLKYSHGYTTREIASILGISFNAASKLDQRAKAKLRELCEKEGLL